LNIEHPTSNDEWEQQKANYEGINGLSFDVQRSEFDVGRSSFPAALGAFLSGVARKATPDARDFDFYRTIKIDP